MSALAADSRASESSSEESDGDIEVFSREDVITHGPTHVGTPLIAKGKRPRNLEHLELGNLDAEGHSSAPILKRGAKVDLDELSKVELGSMVGSMILVVGLAAVAITVTIGKVVL